MRNLFFIAALILAAGISSSAQTSSDSSCPVIQVFGPAGIIPPNEVASYRAEVDTKGQQLDLKYFWSVSAGKIISGQGTLNIEVRQPENASLTVTVEVNGVPEGCPIRASETGLITDHLPPQPVKLAQFDKTKFLGDKVELNKIVQIMSDHPNDQIYIILAYKKGASDERVRKRERVIADFLLTALSEPNRMRMAFVPVFGGVDLVQFWRVPPGADNPKCDACEPASSKIERQDCPMISVTTPAGIIEWGQIATFTANIDDRVSQDATYSWTVSKGAIVSGQGTRSLKIRLPKTNDMRITATIEVRGIRPGCPNRASGTYEYAIDPGPIELGEIRNTSYTIGRKLLAKLGKELRDNPNSQLYVILYFVNDPTEAAERKSKAKLVEQLAATKVDKARFTFVQAPGAVRKVNFFRVPPGAHTPTP